MEGLLTPEQQKAFREQLAPILSGLPVANSIGSNLYAAVLGQIHAYWKSKVYELHRDWRCVTGKDVTKLDKTDIEAEQESKDICIPTLKLGDRVTIDGSKKHMFTLLHKKLGMWNKDLLQLPGNEAVVMNLSSPLAVGVSLIGSENIAWIHGSVLKPVSDDTEMDFWKNNTDFKRNDKVVIGVEDDALAYLQESARKTPFPIALQLRDFIGRVMGCFRGEVVVTFDEMNHELFNPAALKIYKERDPGKKLTDIKSSINGQFKKNDRVIVISDGLKVMDLQRGHGEWSYKMTQIIGKKGVVMQNFENGDVGVKFNRLESYRMNSNALKKAKGKTMPKEAYFGKLPFKVGDIVHLSIGPIDLLSCLQLIRIPVEFAWIVAECMTFIGYHSDRRAVVDIGNGRELILATNVLAKASNPESYKGIKKKDNNLKVGSKVSLFAGPKSYVITFLKEFKAGFEKAMDQEGTFEGYDDNGNAVVSYDGKLYSVPDDCICSPRKNWHATEKDTKNRPTMTFTDWSKETVEVPASVSALETAILCSITDVLKKNKETETMDWEAKIHNKSDSPLKKIEVTFPTTLKDFEEFTKEFKGRLVVENCRMEEMGGRVIVMHTQQQYEIVFTQTTSSDGNTLFKTPAKDMGVASAIDFGRSNSVTDEVLEQKPASNAAQPVAEGTASFHVDRNIRQVLLQIGGSQTQQQQQPLVASQPQVPPNPPLNSGSVMPPRVQNIFFNMYGEGGNRVEVNNSRVDAINTEN